MAPSEGSVALPEGLRLRHLCEADIPQALSLSQEAGWNQIAADWRIFLELGEAYGLADGDGERLIATAAILPHGDRCGWISMVLVTVAQRRRGLARRLLQHCIAALSARRLVPMLDATPAGRTVYLGLGFEDCWSLRRLVLRTPLRPVAPIGAESAFIRPLRASDWPAIAGYDRAVFGADRAALLRRLAERVPSAALVAEGPDGIVGLLLGREGRVMTQLGPIIADDDAVARSLIHRALATLEAPVAIDLADRHAPLGEWLGQLGFMPERPLTRMVRGLRTGFGDPTRLFAIAGPELG